MSTLGQKPATQHVSTEKQTITGNGGTSYTLQQSVSQASDIEVFVNNTRQEPTVAYTANNTTLTMTGAVNASDSFYVIFQGKAIQTAGLPVDAAITASTMSLSETLAVTGAATLSSNATVGGTLGVTGTSTLSGNAAIGGTLAVTGVHTIGNNAVLTSEGGAATYSLPQSTIKAWNRTQHGNAMELDGFGFSSVTDSGVGYYTPAFTNNMNNSSYGFLTSADDKSDGASIFVYNLSSSYTVSTSGFRMSFKKYSYSLTDPNQNATVAIVGDLA